MPVLDDPKKRTATAVRLALLTLGLCLLVPVGAIQAQAQDIPAQTHVIAVQSDPPGATIWKRNGRDYTCIGALTPTSVELAFHGDNDLQRLYLRRFGYAVKTLDVKATDKDAVAALGQLNSSSFLLAENAPAELKQLNATLKKEFEKAILGNLEAFRCAPFNLDYINLAKNTETGAVELSVALTLDRSFGGSAFRLASHAGAAPERSQKMGQVALENGIAEILGRFHRITARFPGLKVINVLGSYSTTEAALDTKETARVFHSQTTQTATFGMGRYGIEQTGTVFTTTSGWTGGEKYTVVTDQDADKTISFVMPADQIPDTLDNKAISDAVLVAGKISVLKGGHILPEEFHHAIVHHDLEKVRGMIQAIPDLVFSKGEEGYTALDLAALAGDIPIMKLLLANRADINARDDSGTMPLAFAVLGNHWDAAEFLLANHADANAGNDDGMTPLHIAAMEGDKEIAVMLLNSGANVNAKSRAGSSPLFLALKKNHSDVAEVLRQHGGRK